ETNNFGFYIERKADDSPYTEIGFVKGNGTTQSANYYSFDDKPPLSGKLTYQLRQVDFDGTFSSSKAVEVHLAPMQSFLLPAYPNPFNSSTVIKFNLQKAEHVKIRILNIRGEQVRVLSDHQMKAGEHTLHWRGKNANGVQVPSGTYFIQLVSKQRTLAETVVLIK
ncbi:MAG: T9SS type A sorting domain-containing protein, partial [Calditrichaeota bacterium]|nr:T9SS type A sorting domain-containing protein [Calditrichota bacterium]